MTEDLSPGTPELTNVWGPFAQDGKSIVIRKSKARTLAGPAAYDYEEGQEEEADAGGGGFLAAEVIDAGPYHDDGESGTGEAQEDVRGPDVDGNQDQGGEYDLNEANDGGLGPRHADGSTFEAGFDHFDYLVISEDF